ncbi:MAG: MucR family transcriptional regulator [Desulfuromonas sp.]|nr:MAG: MucR family transcriptional regulator [Desulfuromonas sp.]
MANLIEMATEIVAAHASASSMTKDEIIAEIQEVYATLSALEKGETVPVAGDVQEENVPAVSKRKAFGKDTIYCMVCGKGFKTLKRHLAQAHELTPKEYRAQFDIPAGTALAAKSYSESRRQMAIDKGLADGLAKARAAKKK